MGETEVQWTIRDRVTGELLISVGGEGANRDRLRDLKKDAPDRYELVRRVAIYGPWKLEGE